MENVLNSDPNKVSKKNTTNVLRNLDGLSF